MNELPASRRLNCLLALALICLPATWSGAADRARKPMRETATVPADKNVQKRFGTIEDYMAEKRWAEAIDVLQEIAQTDGRMLVLAQPGAAGESAVYVNVATRCSILLTQLPSEGLTAYRKKVDPQAKRWLDRWQQSHDEADLLRIVREAYLSSYGDDTLWALGEAAWDRGDLATARLYWTQLVPLGKEARAENLTTVLRYPDSDLNPAEVLARLVLCTLMEGERDRAADELSRFRKQYPDAQGSLAGKRGPLADLLQQIIADAADWPARPDTGDVSTFALNPRRDGVLPATIEIGASKWSRSLPSARIHSPERPNAMPDRGPLSYFPVTYQDVVLVNNARSIWAWNVLTGEAAWPSDRGTAEIYPPVPDTYTGTPTQISSGVPYYTMTIADGRLYARMGSSVTNPTDSENSSEPFDSDLVCLDLANGQGKLLWKVAAHELIKEDSKPWRFEGSPLVMAGRAYVALSRRRPQLEFTIACLEANSGTLLWNRMVVAARGPVEDHQHRVSHLLLTAGQGKLFLSTDAGAIVAVDARDGRLDWAVTYESLMPPRSWVLSSHLYQGLIPALFHEGLLFVAPNDCNRVFCIDADSGRVRWQHRHPETDHRWRYMLGVAAGGEAGRLILSGNSLWAIDIATNKIAFGARANSLGSRAPPSEQGYGRGILAGDVILWPTVEAIKVVDARTGTTIGNKPLNVPGISELGGNLTIAQDMLLVAQPERLVAYCEYSLLKQRLERAISERMESDPPSDVLASPAAPGHRLKSMSRESLLGQLADLELAEGNLDGATATLRKAISTSESDEHASARFRIRLMELLRQSARTAISEGHATVAVDRLTEARQLAQDPDDLIVILLETADAELARSRPVAAVEMLQQILDSDQLRNRPYRISTAGRTASASIADLIGKRSRAVYSEIEQKASRDIAAQMQTGDLDGMQRMLERYPNAEATGRAWRQLASTCRRDGQFDQALAIQARLLDESTRPEDRAVALLDWAETLQAAGYSRSARSAWTHLTSSEVNNLEINIDGAAQRAGNVARRHLDSPDLKPIDSKPASGYLDRIWSKELQTETSDDEPSDPRGASVLVPLNDAPARELSCVLVRRTRGSEADWECIDRTTGKSRWSQSLPRGLRWSAYGDSHLLLATEDQLFAVTLQTGNRLWSTPLTQDKGDDDHRSKRTIATSPCLRDHWVLAFDVASGVTAINSRTGQIAWSFMPPRGKLQQHWSCGSRQIALQTLQPAITWTIEIAAERKVAEVPGALDPWLQGPVQLPDGLNVLVASDRRIEARQVANGLKRWQFQGGLSFAHVDPVLWSTGQELLLTVDGTTLTRINPTTGRTEWSTGVADAPLISPASQVIAAGDAAFAANNGLLRRISLKYGDTQWERFLGSNDEQWRIARCGDLIAAWPVGDGPSKRSNLHRGQAVTWCEFRSGRIVQRMNLRSGEQIVDVSANELGCLVQSNRQLVALRSSSPTDASTR